MTVTCRNAETQYNVVHITKILVKIVKYKGICYNILETGIRFVKFNFPVKVL